VESGELKQIFDFLGVSIPRLSQYLFLCESPRAFPNPSTLPFRDRSETAFTGLFAYSHEWLHVSFELLTFYYMDICTDSLVLAAALTYLLSTSLHIVSNVFYVNNVVKTSCLDARFVQ
jgi:hypothetical protein